MSVQGRYGGQLVPASGLEFGISGKGLQRKFSLDTKTLVINLKAVWETKKILKNSNLILL